MEQQCRYAEVSNKMYIMKTNYEWEIVEGGNNISRTQTVIFAHLSACNKSLE